ncbi:MAG: hypothetical protein GY801_14375, partial [bacterium]|nr:hypothetical protein [bacterium]
MPETLLLGLKKLAEQEYAEEDLLLAEIKKLIGGRLTVRYKLPVLEYAATGQEVFTIETEDLVVAATANYASIVTMIVNDKARQTDVRVERGRFKMHRLNDEGFVRIFGLSNVQTQEGLQFAFNTSGGFARINVEECTVSAETNVPVSDYYALIGNTDNLVSIRNEADSAAVKVIREDEASSVELGGEQEAL